MFALHHIVKINITIVKIKILEKLTGNNFCEIRERKELEPVSGECAHTAFGH